MIPGRGHCPETGAPATHEVADINNNDKTSQTLNQGLDQNQGNTGKKSASKQNPRNLQRGILPQHEPVAAISPSSTRLITTSKYKVRLQRYVGKECEDANNNYETIETYSKSVFHTAAHRSTRK